jgi:hypothetical protein
MSHKTQRPLLLFVALLLALFTLPQAHADTYILFSFVEDSGAAPVIGIDDAGDVLIRRNLVACGLNALSCYSVFQPFGSLVTTEALPAFNYDNGTPCSPNPLAAFGFCNNGYEAYYVSTVGPDRGISGGPYTDVQKFPDSDGLASPHTLLINSYGDITWTEGSTEENYLAYDVTSHETPEPATLALLLTGLIPIAEIARRKLTRA